jgi:uncharacterized membrane protein
VVGLVASAVFFAVLHLGVSGTRLRDGLVSKLGEGPYMGLFSLASAGGLAALAWTYSQAPRTTWWVAPGPMLHLTPALMAVSVWFVVLGLTTPSPTLTLMDGLLEREDAARGILRITRHPMLAGFALWSIWHLVINGDGASVVLFSSLAVVSVAGPPSIDRKRRRKHGPRWDVFAARTSIVPFAAIATGRNRLVGSEIPAWQWLVAAGTYVALVAAHPVLFGVSAIPG